MTRPLRIRIISKATSLGGGGSRVAEELAAGLRRAGHEAVHLPGYYHHEDNEGTRHLYGKWCRKFIRATHDATARLGLQEILPVEFPTALRQGILGADIVHFHDINAVMSPLSVALASLFAKVVWTFHDCSPFTAGCLYPNECRAYETQCRRCPEKGSWPLRPNARTRVQFGLRKAVCRMTGFQPVTPSRWMRGMAERSAMRLAPIEVLPNGVDTDKFRPASWACPKTAPWPSSPPACSRTSARARSSPLPPLSEWGRRRLTRSSWATPTTRSKAAWPGSDAR
jgi:glycosyltransferase involved in cell wall biosynthesis